MRVEEGRHVRLRLMAGPSSSSGIGQPSAQVTFWGSPRRAGVAVTAMQDEDGEAKQSSKRSFKTLGTIEAIIGWR